jgi:hypothetical protein
MSTLKHDVARPVDKKQRLCEKCQAEPGDAYTFLYGKTVTYTPTASQSTTHIQVKGEDSAVVGDRCIAKDRRKGILLRAVLALTMTGAVVGSLLASGGGPLDSAAIPDSIILVVPIGGLLTLAAVVSLAGELTASKRDRGETIAISLRKEKLKRMGYNYFTTQRGWQATKTYEGMQGR